MVTLYSTGCPQCRVLEQKLKDAGVEFCISDNIDKIIDMGFMTAPVLEVDDKFMNLQAAFQWVGKINETGGCESCQISKATEPK